MTTILFIVACLISLGIFYGLLILFDLRRGLNNYMAQRRYEAAVKHMHQDRKKGGE